MDDFTSSRRDVVQWRSTRLCSPTALRMRWEIRAAQRCAHTGPAVPVGGKAAAFVGGAVSANAAFALRARSRAGSSFMWEFPLEAILCQWALGATALLGWPWIAQMGQKRGEVLGWYVGQLPKAEWDQTQSRGPHLLLFERE